MIQRTFLIILMVGWLLGPTLAGDWPQWRGPDRTGVSKETGLLPSWPRGGPKLLWTFRDAGTGFSCMSIVGDRLYSMGGDGKKEYVYAIDLNTRKKLWSVEVGPFLDGDGWDGPRSTPTIDGNYLYALGGHGDLVCVETAGGKKVWSQGMKTSLGGKMPPYGYCESPLVDGDQVVVAPGGKQGTIAAFDKRTGTLKWRSPNFDNSASYSSMIAIETGGVRQYVQITITSSWALAGVRASDGKLLWRFAKEAGESATPIYGNDCVYVSRDTGCHLLKLRLEGDQFKTELIYHNTVMNADHGGVILVGEYLYGYGSSSGWVCQDFKTGKKVWNKNLNMGNGSVTFADGNLYGYHAKKGDMLLFKATPAGYQQQGKFRIPEESKSRRGEPWIYTHPVVANGKLYLRDQELIFCYDVRKPR